MTADFVRLEELSDARAPFFGHKARMLAKLTRAGFAVPAAIAIACDVGQRVVRAALGPHDHLGALLSGEPPEEARLLGLGERIRAAGVPSDVRVQLATALRTLAPAPHGLAVRSSSTVEDDADASAAGMNVTTLGVVDEDGLVIAYLETLASLYGPRAIAYARAHGRDRIPAMGVVLQRLVAADAAGVGFSCHPVTGDRTEVVLELSRGLGVGVASGRVMPDVFRFDKASLAVRDRVVGRAREALVPRVGGGVEASALAPELETSPSVDDDTARALAREVVRIEAIVGRPVDVELAVCGGVVSVLQARAIRGLGAGQTPARRASRDRSGFVWSNINVGESLPGVATPFTWSVIAAFSELGFRRAFAALGCTVPDDAELVGDFRGRIYLNMSEFFRVLEQVPFVDARVVSALGGGDFAPHLPPSLGRGRAGFVARLPLTAARFLHEAATLDGRVEAFSRSFEEEQERILSIDPRLLSLKALDRTLLDVERLLDELGSVMLTVYGSLLASVVVLDGWLRIVARDDAQALERALFVGRSTVESAAPALLLRDAARRLDRDPSARAYLRETADAELSVDALPEGPTREAVLHLLRTYGHRGFREAEIGAPRWREDPGAILRMLALEARADVAARHVPHGPRGDAHTPFAARVPLPLRPLARALTDRVQALIGTRERLRSDVVRVLGLYRRVVLEVSRRIVGKEPEAGEGAGFFLTLGETHAYLRGELHGVAPVVARRRARYAREASLPDPPSTFVGSPETPPTPVAEGDRLVGLAASSGRARGTVRVLHGEADLHRFRRGDVLVVAACDVGWTPVFVEASAVVTELGGPLSHAAIVLRELGIPTVVNVRDATRRLADGDDVLVDGDLGEVLRHGGRATG